MVNCGPYVRLDLQGIHAGLGLQGVQHVDAQIDQVRQQGVDIPVGVTADLDALGVRHSTARRWTGFSRARYMSSEKNSPFLYPRSSVQVTESNV